MLKQVILALNAIDSETWTQHNVADIRQFLSEQFAEWPEHAHIYHKYISVATDVTPKNELDVEALGEMEGPFYVVVYPGEPITILYAIVAVIFVGVVVLAASMQPPNSALRNTQSQSPNNELSERTNKPRPNGRIPDIYGTVRSTPDLISVPYKVFEDNQEVEYAYMCIGRGSYQVSDIRDDTTLSSDIAGTSVEVYAPFTSPNSGQPQQRVGEPIATPVLSVTRSNSVNGQVLRAPNDRTIIGNSNIRFAPPNEIQYKPNLTPTEDFDFTKEFEAGENITVERTGTSSVYFNDSQYITAVGTSFRFAILNATLPPEYQPGKELILQNASFIKMGDFETIENSYDLSGSYNIFEVTHTVIDSVDYCNVFLDSPYSVNVDWGKVDPILEAFANIKVAAGEELGNLNGTFEILSVSKELIRLVSPATVNPNWGTMTLTNYISPRLSANSSTWIGPFILSQTDMTGIICNFVATNGLYKDDGKNQTSIDVAIQIEVTPINLDGTPRGQSQNFGAVVIGSSKVKNTRAVTLRTPIYIPGRCQVRARRSSLKDTNFEGTVVDEVKWRDMYSSSPVATLNFGDITTVQSITYATEGALALKERKLNMLVTRKIPLRVSGSTFTAGLMPTNDAAEIISAICLDRRIGNRNKNEIDFDSIYNAVASARSYFGTDLAGEFCYTFDSDNLSFEEMITSISDAVFCKAYRRGNILKMNFERATDNSTLMFNHQNKLPNSETRTIRFGNEENYDGVSFKYVDPEDDALVTLYIPEDQSAINPKSIESLGVRNRLQAYLHAWRLWNKVRFQNTIVEFKATHEADLLVTNDRILVADNTRSETQDGQIENQNGLLLTLSHSVTMANGINYSLFVQYADETIESIPVTPGPHTNEVVLSRAPRIPLAIDDEFYAKTTFVLVGNNDITENAFLVSEKSPDGNMTSTIRAVNYDSRYYQNDKDFINGLINQDGNTV